MPVILRSAELVELSVRPFLREDLDFFFELVVFDFFLLLELTTDSSSLDFFFEPLGLSFFPVPEEPSPLLFVLARLAALLALARR